MCDAGILGAFRWQVMGSFSFSHAEVLMRDDDIAEKLGGKDPAFLGLKVCVLRF